MSFVVSLFSPIVEYCPVFFLCLYIFIHRAIKMEWCFRNLLKQNYIISSQLTAMSLIIGSDMVHISFCSVSALLLLIIPWGRMNRPSFSMMLLHFSMTGLPAEVETLGAVFSDFRHLLIFSSGTASLQCALCSRTLVRTSSVPLWMVRKNCLLPHLSGNPELSRWAVLSSPVSRQKLFRLKGRKRGRCAFSTETMWDNGGTEWVTPRWNWRVEAASPCVISEGVGEETPTRFFFLILVLVWFGLVFPHQIQGRNGRLFWAMFPWALPKPWNTRS